MNRAATCDEYEAKQFPQERSSKCYMSFFSRVWYERQITNNYTRRGEMTDRLNLRQNVNAEVYSETSFMNFNFCDYKSSACLAGRKNSASHIF